MSLQYTHTLKRKKEIQLLTVHRSLDTALVTIGTSTRPSFQKLNHRAEWGWTTGDAGNMCFTHGRFG